MTGYWPMLLKEARGTVRTWRGWVLLGAFVLFSVVDPILTRFLPEIMRSMVGNASPVPIPDTTYLQAWGQWTKDLSQLLMVLVVVVTGGSVAGEVSSGTAMMPLTKPLSRPAFVLAKLTAVLGLVVACVLVGSGIATAVTAIAFPHIDAAPLWRAVAAWVVLAGFVVTITLAASCLVRSTVGAIGIGVGIYIGMSAVTIWPPAARYSPAGLGGIIGSLAGNTANTAWEWPVATGILAAALLVLLAIVIFRRKEI